MGRWVPALIASILMLLVGPAASAWGDAKVRFVQTVPGAGALELHATEGGINQRVGRRLGFGADRQLRGRARRRGRVRGPSRPAGGPSPRRASELREPARTTPSSPWATRAPLVLRDGGAEGGQSHLRVVHAAPELGRVDVRLGDAAGRRGRRHRGRAPATRPSAPGAYALSVTRPDGGSPIASRGRRDADRGHVVHRVRDRHAAASRSQTIVASDRAAAPRGAPATGLGGLAGEDPAAAARPARGPAGRPRRRRDLRGADRSLARR